MSEPIRVNFGRSIPIFPLHDTVLLPLGILPLHIFEPRYRQLVSTVLDRSGQMAIGTIDTENRCDEDEAPALRPAACVGQIIQHDALTKGRYNILLHGVCRARIKKVIEPSGDREYRLADLDPIEPSDSPDSPMSDVRDELREILSGSRLQRLRCSDTLMEWADRDDVPTTALLELIGYAVVRDTELKYQLLAEPDPRQRADLIRDELRSIDRLICGADRQSYRAWPKGMSWN